MYQGIRYSESPLYNNIIIIKKQIINNQYIDLWCIYYNNIIIIKKQIINKHIDLWCIHNNNYYYYSQETKLINNQHSKIIRYLDSLDWNDGMEQEQWNGMECEKQRSKYYY